jgi:CPA1 family monovalent cation:H+ antiporter
MEIILMVVLLLLAVIVANTVNLVYPKIPLALYQIAAGMVLSFDSQFHHFVIHPEIFMLIIIAPLMFKDGKSTSLRALRTNLSTILSLSVGLSVVTVIIAGFFINWIWSAATLPIAFLLAAIITPTDAVAVSSITRNVEVPTDVHQALEHESLFNDAAGIVLFGIALSSITSGNFSVFTSILDFGKTFFGGIIIGFILGYLVTILRLNLTRTHTDISAIIVPVEIMTPLFVYWVAEEIGVSGILAVVAAGLVFAAFQTRLRLTSTKLQIVTTTTWAIISDILNGFVFVLLGATLPSVMSDRGAQDISILLIGGVIIYVLITLIRYVWFKFNLAPSVNSSNNHALNGAIGGVHGTIALAMAFSIPTGVNSTLTELRGQLIFVTATVILVSLLVATFVFPYIAPKKQDELSQQELSDIFRDLIYYAESQLRNSNPKSKEVDRVSGTIGSQTRSFTTQPDRKKYVKLIDQVHQVELDTLDQMEDNNEITHQERMISEKILRKSLDLFSNHGFVSTFNFLSRNLKRKFHFGRNRRRRIEERRQRVGQHNRIDRKKMLSIIIKTTEAVQDYLRTLNDKENAHEINFILEYYNQLLQRYQSNENLDDDLMSNLFIQAFQYEHSFVQQQLASGQISTNVANNLNEQISTDELVYMQSLN